MFNVEIYIYAHISIFRYDGQRAQIHKLADGSVRVFSRNGDETTSRFPDLVNIITESCGPRGVTFILDAEVFFRIPLLCRKLWELHSHEFLKYRNAIQI